MDYLFLISAISILISHLVLINRIKIAKYLHLIDKPDKKRKTHKIDVPLIGGLYIFTAFIIFFIISSILIYDYQIRFILALLLISTSFFFIGLVDDIITISSISRIILIITSTIISCSLISDFQIKEIYLSFYKPETSINLGFYFTVFSILALNISINLSDGTNGVAGIQSFIWLIFFSYLIYEIDKDYFYSILFLLVVLSIFLIFNLKTKCFLGSSGCNILSALISFTAIYINKITTLYSDTIFIFFLIPGLDMCRVIFSRILNKRNPFSPDRNHLHHHLEKIIDKNYVFIIYGIFTFMFGLISILFPKFNFILIIMIVIIYIISLIYLNKFKS